MRILPATLASASFVCANLREADREEAFCQLPDGFKTHELAYAMLMSGDNYVVEKRAQEPIAFFGVSPMNVAAYSVWAIGTDEFKRAVPAMQRFIVGNIVPDLMDRGVRILEARAMEKHLSAHQWIHRTGGRPSGMPFEYGRNGEKFVLFRWTKDALQLHQRKRK